MSLTPEVIMAALEDAPPNWREEWVRSDMSAIAKHLSRKLGPDSLAEPFREFVTAMQSYDTHHPWTGPGDYEPFEPAMEAATLALDEVGA